MNQAPKLYDFNAPVSTRTIFVSSVVKDIETSLYDVTERNVEYLDTIVIINERTMVRTITRNGAYVSSSAMEATLANICSFKASAYDRLAYGGDVLIDCE
jgi:hypothetical protein